MQEEGVEPVEGEESMVDAVRLLEVEGKRPSGAREGVG